jgi:hypothetical protein
MIRGNALLPMRFREKVLFLPAKTVPNRKFAYGVYLGVLQSRMSCSWPRTTASSRCARSNGSQISILPRLCCYQQYRRGAGRRSDHSSSASGGALPMFEGIAGRPRPDRAEPAMRLQADRSRGSTATRRLLWMCRGATHVGARHPAHLSGMPDSAWRWPWRPHRQAKIR